MSQIEAMEIALEALKDSQDYIMGRAMTVEAAESLEKAIAEAEKQEQGEPVAWIDKENPDVIVSAKDWDNIDPLWYWMYRPLYTTPQQRKPLTDEEIEREWQFLHDEEGNPPDHHDFARAIEAKLKAKDERKEKNT